LLNQGADVGVLDDDGYSPFAVACLRGNITVAEHILNHVPITFARKKLTRYGTRLTRSQAPPVSTPLPVDSKGKSPHTTNDPVRIAEVNPSVLPPPPPVLSTPDIADLPNEQTNLSPSHENVSVGPEIDSSEDAVLASASQENADDITSESQKTTEDITSESQGTAEDITSDLEEEKENIQGKEGVRKVNAKKLLDAFGGSNKKKGKSLLAQAKGKKQKKKLKKGVQSADVPALVLDQINDNITLHSTVESSPITLNPPPMLKTNPFGAINVNEDEEDYKIELDTQTWDQPTRSKTKLEAHDQGEVCLGMRVVKHFGDFGLFEAVVESFEESTGWWRLRYEDGEEEDLLSEEVKPLREHWIKLNSAPSPTEEIDSPIQQGYDEEDEGERALAMALASAEAAASDDEVDEILKDNSTDDDVNGDDDDDDDLIIEDSVCEMEPEEMVVEEMGDIGEEEEEWKGSSVMSEAAEAMQMVMAAMGTSLPEPSKPRALSPIVEVVEKSMPRRVSNIEEGLKETDGHKQENNVDQPEVVEKEEVDEEDEEYDEMDDDEEVVLLRALHNYVNLRACDGMTALHLAASENHAPCVEWLLSLGADVAQRNEAGETALFTASKLGHVQVVRLLAQRDPEGVLEGGPNGTSAILAACTGGHIRCVDVLEKATASLGSGLQSLRRLRELDDVLLEVCKAGHRDIAEHLLKAGADLNTCNELGETPIIVASHYGHTDLVQYLLHRSCDFVSGRNARHRGGIGVKVP